MRQYATTFWSGAKCCSTSYIWRSSEALLKVPSSLAARAGNVAAAQRALLRIGFHMHHLAGVLLG